MKRNEVIQIRVSPDEKEQLAKIASDLGLTVSDLLRNRAFGTADVAASAKPEHVPGPVERVFG